MLDPNQQAAPTAVSFLPEKSPAAGVTPEGQAPSPQEDFQIMGHEQETQNGQANKEEIAKNLAAHLDQIPDDQKQFLAEHLTPEFVRAIGIINGPEVAEYLGQFADPNKVLVPVPREIAEKFLAEQQQGQSAPQGQPQPAPQQGQPNMAPPAQAPMAQPPMAAPPQGMMAPRQ